MKAGDWMFACGFAFSTAKKAESEGGRTSQLAFPVKDVKMSAQALP